MNDGHTRLKRFGAGAAFLWTAVLLTVPVAVVVFAVFIVAAARSNSAALDIDAAAAVGDRTAAVIDSYVAHLVDDTRALADIPAVRERASAPTRPMQPADAKRLDEAWIRRRATPAPTDVQSVIEEILERPVSRYFADLCDNKAGIVREVLLTDRAGRLVAASGPTEDFDQQDEEWWKEAVVRSGSCASAKDCAYAGDVEFDRSVGGRGFEVAVPVFDDKRAAAGVLKIVFDPRDLSPLLTLAAANHPVIVSLIRRDGTEVLGDSSPFAADDGSDDAGVVPASVRDSLRALDGEQQTTVQVGGAARPVRALSGPHFDKWAVVILDRSGTPIQGWGQIGALVAIIVVMFLLSTRAYALLFHRVRGAE